MLLHLMGNHLPYSHWANTHQNIYETMETKTKQILFILRHSFVLKQAKHLAIWWESSSKMATELYFSWPDLSLYAFWVKRPIFRKAGPFNRVLLLPILRVSISCGDSGRWVRGRVFSFLVSNQPEVVTQLGTEDIWITWRTFLLQSGSLASISLRYIFECTCHVALHEDF